MSPYDTPAIEYVAEHLAQLPEADRADPIRVAACVLDALRDYEFEAMIRQMEREHADT